MFFTTSRIYVKYRHTEIASIGGDEWWWWVKAYFQPRVKAASSKKTN